jgi:cytosine/adenosine deaminase-related metal-dependent hydrolase
MPFVRPKPSASGRPADPPGDSLVLVASAVLIGPRRCCRPGFVRVVGDRILEAGELSRSNCLQGRRVFLDGAVLSPGLINAHCHLDYTCLRGKLPKGDFTRWLQSIVEEKSKLSPEEIGASLREGYSLLVRSGTTTVANIEAYPELGLALTPPIRVLHFLELLDVRSVPWSEERLAAFWKGLLGKGSLLQRAGLAPHAPYTASMELYRLVAKLSERFGIPWTTHVAESLEEDRMFREASGPLYQWLRGLGRDCADCGRGSPLALLARAGVLGPKALLVHVHYADREDRRWIVRSGASLVYCPKSHAFFGHAPYPLKVWQELGVRVVLGTDSLASNDTLDLREEIRHARIQHPGLPPAHWWWMVTGLAGSVLQWGGKLGRIQRGAWADLVAFPWDKSEDPWECLLESKGPPLFAMVAGKILCGPSE